MDNTTSRRDFLLATGAAGSLPLPAGAPSTSRETLKPAAIRDEIRRRARHYAAQRYLVVDYYRIRRKLAYPLPVRDLSLREVPVPTVPGYPWATWMLWELEERVNSLGWAAEWFGDKEFSAAATRDLEALAAWPRYRQYEQPDLSSGHCGRLLWTAYRKWRWPGAATREKIRLACNRHAEEVLPQARIFYGPATAKEYFLSRPQPHDKLANIPLIGTLTAALTAGVAGHVAAAELNQLAQAVFGTVLDLRSRGYAEGVGYDGYILDFLADWLESLPAQERDRVLEHPNFEHHLEQSYMLGAPGAAEEVAELSDVEARQMPFHFSAQVKLALLRPLPVRAWFVRRWPLAWMRANALGALLPLAGKSAGSAPQAGVLDAHYAVVLRTGWDRGDVAVVASRTNSPASHIQNDNGTLVIGTQGQWILSDPGYQQYMRDTERDFTIGPKAHNYPVIDGAVQNAKAGRSLPAQSGEAGLLRAKLDLTACYPAAAALESVVRNVWLDGRNLVVVADEIQGKHVGKVEYCWHGHPDAAWYAGNGRILFHMDAADLWIASPHVQLADPGIVRLPGSRGQLTLQAEVQPAPPVVWWVFALGDVAPAVELESGGRGLRVAGKRFQA